MAATYLVTMKLVGYTMTVHTLLDRLSTTGSIVLFGGLAKERPVPRVDDGLDGERRCHRHGAFAGGQLAPMRVNALHPGIVGDSPFWSGKDAATAAVRDRTPTGRNVAMADIVDAVDFLVRNRSVNGIDLFVDGGWLLQ